jgi:hypothetical protein
VSGICSKHRGHDEQCRLCTAFDRLEAARTARIGDPAAPCVILDIEIVTGPPPADESADVVPSANDDPPPR